MFFVSYKLVQFSLPLNPAIHRMGNAAKILRPSPDVENKKSLNPIFIYCKLSNITLVFIQWINQSALLFQYPFQN